MSDSALHVRIVPASEIDLSDPAPLIVRSRAIAGSLSLDQRDTHTSLDELLFGPSGLNREWRDELLCFLKDHARGQEITYAVAGDPLSGDATVQRLFALEKADDVMLTIERSGAPETLARALAPYPEPHVFIDALTLLEVDAGAPFAGGSLPLSSNQTTVVTNVSVPGITSLQRVLERQYGADLNLVRLHAGDAVDPEPIAVGDVGDVDSVDAYYLIIPAATGNRFYRTSDDLQRLVARLRAPGGCPWDREQTNSSLTRNLIEESYELLEAIESGNVDDMREEMGDFLLQAYLHCQIAEESEIFTLEDALDTLITKLVRRHPHVFETVTVNGSTDVVRNWDEIKRAERADNPGTDKGGPLGNVPASLPALSRAQTLLKRARRSNIAPEDIGHLRDSAVDRVGTIAPGEGILRDLVNIVEHASLSGIDLEEQLRVWTREFERSIASAAEQDTRDTR